MFFIFFLQAHQKIYILYNISDRDLFINYYIYKKIYG